MARALGYTFYPKDYRTDWQVIKLDTITRSLYRDLMDEAYMTDNKITIDKEVWTRAFPYTFEELDRSISVLLEDGLLTACGNNIYSIPKCEKRLSFKRNGKSGGESTAKGTPKQTAKENRKRNIKENEIELKGIVFPKQLNDFLSNDEELKRHIQKNLNVTDQQFDFLLKKFIADNSLGNGKSGGEWQKHCFNWFKKMKNDQKPQPSFDTNR